MARSPLRFLNASSTLTSWRYKPHSRAGSSSVRLVRKRYRRSRRRARRSFARSEERLHHGVVVTISLAGHRDQDAVLAELGLIVDRAILAATIRMVDQA